VVEMPELLGSVADGAIAHKTNHILGDPFVGGLLYRH
jgi:hypothetical protein